MNHGIAFEKYVHDLCERFYSPDLTFRNPFYLKGGRTKRELADLVMPLKDSLIVFQMKSKSEGSTVDLKIKKSRYRRLVQQGVGQFKLLHELVRDRHDIKATSSRNLEVSLSFEMMREIVGVLVVNQPLDQLAGIDPPLAKGLLDFGGIPIHIFSQSDFDLIVNWLDTLPDFLKYLHTRHHVVGRGVVLGSCGETNILAHFISNPRLLDEVRRADRPVLEAHPQILPKTRELPEDTPERRRALGKKVLDCVIETVHDTIGGDPSPYIPDWVKPTATKVTVESYWMILQELVSLDRRSREAVGERLIEKMMKADSTGRGYSLIVPSFHPQIEAREKQAPLFGQSAIIVYSSIQERKDRIDELSRLCVVALEAYGLKQVIGIGVQPWSKQNYYFDFVLKRPDVCVVNPAAIEFAREYFGKSYIEGFIPGGD